MTVSLFIDSCPFIRSSFLEGFSCLGQFTFMIRSFCRFLENHGHCSGCLGTVISIYENSFSKDERLLGVIRRNLLNVFKQLSEVNNVHRTEHPINTLDIRPGLPSNQSSNITIADSPSLLFYYLFDDWYSTYALVAKSEHQYAMELEKLVRSY